MRKSLFPLFAPGLPVLPGWTWDETPRMTRQVFPFTEKGASLACDSPDVVRALLRTVTEAAREASIVPLTLKMGTVTTVSGIKNRYERKASIRVWPP